MNTRLARLPVMIATLILALQFASMGHATVVSIAFADPSADGVYKISGDGTATGPALVATPSTYGTLGWFAVSGLLCFGTAGGDVSGGPTFDGLFNSAPSGAFSTATSCVAGAVIDASSGTTGWGIVGGSTGVTPGYHILGFRTAADRYGWLGVTLVGVNDDFDEIIIERAFINDVAGEGIIAGAEVVPIPAALWLFASAVAGLGFARRKTTA